MKSSLSLLLAFAALLGSYTAQARDFYGVRGPRGGAIIGEDRAVAATRRGFVATGPNGTVAARRPIASPLPAGYIRTVPAGYRTVYFGGYNCFYVGGIYYRPVIYQGATVYVVVR